MYLSFFRDYEMAKMRIVYKLVNYEMNKDLLESVPHQRFLDLVAVCMFMFEGSEINEEGYAISLIRNMHLDMWGITSEELFARAKENTPVLRPYSIRSMDDLLGLLFREGSVWSMHIRG